MYTTDQESSPYLYRSLFFLFRFGLACVLMSFCLSCIIFGLTYLMVKSVILDVLCVLPYYNLLLTSSLIQSYLLFCSAVLAHVVSWEKLHIFGILGCVLYVRWSTKIVLHSPLEREIKSVRELWDLATELGICYYPLHVFWFSKSPLFSLKSILISIIYNQLLFSYFLDLTKHHNTGWLEF